MEYLLAIDFGSTYTKVSAINLSECKVIATARAFTTIETDICVGLESALNELNGYTGQIDYAEILASSSAGGGLKMVACGLVPELTAKASRIAAASAGAKVMRTFSYELSHAECEMIYSIQPDIILLSGGTDGGNTRVITENARKIAEIEGSFSVIIAGNKSAAYEISNILSKAGKHNAICDNVMPVFNVLDITSARNAIRSLFIEKIIVAKGLEKAQAMMSDKIMPTPLAVFEGMELLSRGCDGHLGLGELIAVDVGGATTDVYTMCSGKPQTPGAIEKGLPEPFAKRSVEGDLGLRYSMPSLIEAAGIENIAQKANVLPDLVHEWEQICSADPGRIAEPGSAFKRIDDILAGYAIGIAVERHAGNLQSVFTPFGESFLQTGKDLTGLKNIIGIGGPVINSENPRCVLANASGMPDSDFRSGLVAEAVGSKGFCLKPRNMTAMLDKKYIAAACGLIAAKRPEIAFKIMIDEITEV